jgi:hypothetical protein
MRDLNSPIEHDVIYSVKRVSLNKPKKITRYCIEIGYSHFLAHSVLHIISDSSSIERDVIY